MTVHLPRRLHAPRIDDDSILVWGALEDDCYRCEVCFALPPADFRGPCTECGAPMGRAPIDEFEDWA